MSANRQLVECKVQKGEEAIMSTTAEKVKLIFCELAEVQTRQASLPIYGKNHSECQRLILKLNV